MIDDSPTLLDTEVRIAAFEWLSHRVTEYGDVPPREILAQGFELHGNRVPLVGPQGIFKPRIIKEIPLSITTAPKGPYKDSFGPDEFLLYRYRGSNILHHENVGLRKAFQRNIPLIYFHGIIPGKYLAVWPVFIIGDSPDQLTFKVAVDDNTYIEKKRDPAHRNHIIKDSQDIARRAYITSSVRYRLHQRGFREKVLSAYNDQCALCRLRHRELLDAAHIIPDNEPDGEPVIKNGISLCKLHHAAFDKFFLGIRPDGIVIVRDDVLLESDGPMLRHGLQGLHNKKILLPRKTKHRPSKVLLEKRWYRFKEVA